MIAVCKTSSAEMTYTSEPDRSQIVLTLRHTWNDEEMVLTDNHPIEENGATLKELSSEQLGELIAYKKHGAYDNIYTDYSDFAIDAYIELLTKVIKEEESAERNI